MIEKDRALIHLAVAIGVFQDHDPPHRLILPGSIDIGHVASHLAHPDAAIRIEGDSHGAFDERLARDQFHVKARRDLEGLQCLRR